MFGIYSKYLSVTDFKFNSLVIREHPMNMTLILLRLLQLISCSKIWSVLNKIPCAFEENTYTVLLECPLDDRSSQLIVLFK